MSKLRAEFDKPIVRYGLLMVAVIIAIQQLVLPWFEWRATKVAELRQARSLLVSEDAVIAATARLEAAKQKMSVALGEVQPRFQDPSTNQKVDFPAAARSLFEASGLKVNSVSAEELATDHSGLKSFVVRLELEGSISDMLRAIQAAESGEQYMSFSRMTVFDLKVQRARFRVELQRYVL